MKRLRRIFHGVWVQTFEVFEYVIRDADLGFLTSVAVRFIVSNAFAPHFSLFNLMYAALSSNLIVFDLTQSEYKTELSTL